jgi:hypothetical protein
MKEIATGRRICVWGRNTLPALVSRGGTEFESGEIHYEPSFRMARR